MGKLCSTYGIAASSFIALADQNHQFFNVDLGRHSRNSDSGWLLWMDAADLSTLNVMWNDLAYFRKWERTIILNIWLVNFYFSWVVQLWIYIWMDTCSSCLQRQSLHHCINEMMIQFMQWQGSFIAILPYSYPKTVLSQWIMQIIQFGLQSVHLHMAKLWLQVPSHAADSHWIPPFGYLASSLFHLFFRSVFFFCGCLKIKTFQTLLDHLLIPTLTCPYMEPEGLRIITYSYFHRVCRRLPECMTPQECSPQLPADHATVQGQCFIQASHVCKSPLHKTSDYSHQIIP